MKIVRSRKAEGPRSPGFADLHCDAIYLAAIAAWAAARRAMGMRRGLHET